MSEYAEWWGHREGEPWDEEEAIRLLKVAADEVAMYEETGAGVPDREHYHARIEAAHKTRDMAAYREAINGYVEAAREACRIRKWREASRRRGRS